MKIEVRSDGAHISGYVNAVQRESLPVITPHGRVNEEIEPGAFAAALERGGDIPLTVDHEERVYASTGDGSMQLHEDNIGLHADVWIKDPELTETARSGGIRGWSFGMRNVRDELEHRTDALPLRHVKGFELDHLTLVVHKTPAYSATSVEVRAEIEETTEIRSAAEDAQITEETPRFDNSAFHARVEAAKNRK